MKIDELQTEFQPSTDLWDGIEADIRGPAPKRKLPWRPIAVVAAVAAVALVSSLGTWWWTQPVELVVVEVSVPTIAAWEAEILQTNAELLAHLDAEQGEMDPELVQVIRENLAIMDVAIVRVRAAMEADPDNDQLAANLAFVYQRKLDLLRRASEIAG